MALQERFKVASLRVQIPQRYIHGHKSDSHSPRHNRIRSLGMVQPSTQWLQKKVKYI